nr:immunoglobulin heavy chain junction region [Macaca mulatta]
CARHVGGAHWRDKGGYFDSW